ncbi:hypothetical protein P5V15_003742 [Pogonomyrmex californicus]
MNQTEYSRPGTSNMYTPRTSRMQERQRFDVSRPRLEEDEIDGLEELIGQTWNIYAASALFGFQQDDIHLKLYSKKLREEIASTLSREDVTYDTKFSIIEDIASGSNYENHPAIKIEVVAKTNSHEKNVEKTIYKGILLSWKVTRTGQNIQNSIRLPLLLCRGTRSCMDAVHSIIGCMFDCVIMALPAKEYDLNWLVPIIIVANNEEDQPIVSGEVKMEYTVPELPVTDTITIKFPTSDLRKILTVIIKDDNDRINISLNREHIEMFHEVLHKQMLVLGGLHLGLCTLHKINLPGITIMENRMKVMNIEIMDNILMYLSERAFDIFHTVCFDI